VCLVPGYALRDIFSNYLDVFRSQVLELAQVPQIADRSPIEAHQLCTYQVNGERLGACKRDS